MLLEAGELKAADDLYSRRCGQLVWFSAPHWGVEVARGFVRDEALQQALAQKLSPLHVGFYLNAVGLFADLAGEPETALEFYTEATEPARRQNDNENLSRGLQNLGQTEVSLGLLGKRNSLTSIACTTSLRGVRWAEHLLRTGAVERTADWNRRLKRG